MDSDGKIIDQIQLHRFIAQVVVGFMVPFGLGLCVGALIDMWLGPWWSATAAVVCLVVVLTYRRRLRPPPKEESE